MTSSNPLRPTVWADFIGQLETVERLQIMVSAARTQSRTLDHVLLTGPPGLGKTTLAGIIATALGVEMRTITSTALPIPAALVDWLIPNAGRVAFIDEVHRLSREVSETLLPIMEDYVTDTTFNDRAVRVQLETFTLIGATTRAGSLLAPLRDRFGIIERLKPYSNEDLAKIITRSARILELDLPLEAIDEIASRSRGTPRVANRLVARVRDWAVHNKMRPTLTMVDEALDAFGADSYGLDETGRLILSALAAQTRAVGMTTLAALVDEDPDTIEPLEAHLLRVGLIEKTPRGRLITSKGREHMEVTI